jgi:GxxExxY protein
VFYNVYNELGHGFPESVYENAMTLALREAGLGARQQTPVTVLLQRTNRGGDFRADLLVNNTVIVELKAAKSLDSTHEAQLLNYHRTTDLEVGLLMNFGPKSEFKRLAFDNERKVRPQMAAMDTDRDDL